MKYPERGYLHHSALDGTNQGEECLILGYGPSRTRYPELGFKGDVFAINRAVDIAPDAKYWCAHERSVVTSHKEFRKPGSTLLTQGVNCRYPEFHDDTKDLKVVLIDAEADPTRWPQGERPLYWNETTFGWTLHLAIRMGYSRIYTLGIDCTLGYGHGVLNPFMDEEELHRQHQGVKERTIEMFVNPAERVKWMERSVEILDLSGGNLPVPKVHGILERKLPAMDKAVHADHGGSPAVVPVTAVTDLPNMAEHEGSEYVHVPSRVEGKLTE